MDVPVPDEPRGYIGKRNWHFCQRLWDRYRIVTWDRDLVRLRQDLGAGNAIKLGHPADDNMSSFWIAEFQGKPVRILVGDLDHGLITAYPLDAFGG